jgi:hypothetical protein
MQVALVTRNPLAPPTDRQARLGTLVNVDVNIVAIPTIVV